jgi:chorismate synthase
MKKFILLSSLLVLSACSSIQGVVRDKSTGTPIPSAIVNVNQYSDSTDAVGHYEVTGAFAPGYTVMVNAPGYNIYTQTLKSTKEIIDIELTPKN